MKTKTYKISFVKIIFSFFILLNSSFAFCSTSSSWVLAAEQFDFTQKDLSKAYEATAKSIPSLILEQIAENLTRMTRAQEQLDRKLYDLQKDRLSLFLQLSSEVQKRDAIFLNSYSERILASKIKEEDKKISEIEKKIKKNLDEVRENAKKYEPQIQKDLERNRNMEEGRVVDFKREENKILEMFRGFIPGQNIEQNIENVSFYKNDIRELFSVSDEIKQKGYLSYNFEKACVDAKINGLITGVITKYGNFMSVSVSLYQFPGAKVIGHAMEVGDSSDLKYMAISLARQLTPKISDSMPVELFISVEPEEASKNFSMMIDDVVYKSVNRSIITQSGIHTISFSSPGFDTVSTSFNFVGRREFEINAKLLQTNEGSVHFALAKPYAGDIFGNGLFGGSISDDNRFANIKINNHPILAHFIYENDVSADIYIPINEIYDGAYLVANAKPFNRSKYIESRRKLMYTSYSLLMVSLLPTFYCYGNSYAASNAYNSGQGVDYETAVKWQDASNITIGVSCVLGAWFAFELVRYLKAADTVLPAKAKPLSAKKLKKIQEKEQKAILKKEAEQKALEEALLEQDSTEELYEDTKIEENN